MSASHVSSRRLNRYWRRPDEGEALWLLGGLYTFKALGEETGNAYTLVEVVAEAGFAVPLHFHDEEEEGFYVVAGEVSFIIGEQTVRTGAGSFAFVSRGVNHTFKFESPGSRLLLLLTPGPAPQEALFREMGEPAKTHTIPPAPEGLPDLQRLAEIAAKHGTKIVGPPPGGG